LPIEESLYVEAARATEGSHARIIARHIFPGVVSPLLVKAAADIGDLNIIVGKGMIMYDKVVVENKGSICIVRINRPEVLNALDRETKRLLKDTFHGLGKDPDVQAIVLTGTGNRAFCSGQDIHESVAMGADDASAWVAEFDQLYQSVRQCPKPVVASIQGYAVGSGFQLALLADLRVASVTAKFAMTEIDVGIPCITGSTLLWPILGRARTLELILTGRFLSAQEALAWGIAAEVVEDDPFGRAIEVAHLLSEKTARAIRLNKQWINELTEEVYQRGVAAAKAAHGEAYGSGDAAEHMKHFLQRG
jgi:enoyl-CoA hydratase